MIYRTFNPYTTIGIQHTAGMDAIAAVFAPAGVPTNINFAIEIAKYVGGIYYPPLPLSVKLNIQIQSTVAYTLNGYSNSIIKLDSGGYATNLGQLYFVQKLLTSVVKSPINEIQDVILDIEDNITKSDLSFDEQVPLLMAAEVGKQNIAYWLPKIATPGDWTIFFDSNRSINTSNIPYWVAASMEGTLLMAKRSTTYPLIDGSTVPNAGVDLAAALSGSIAAGAGKVLYRIIRRITSLNQGSMDGCEC
jgi:hypothetical protein